MDQRIFTLNNNYCIIHYPERPNGFGVLVIGGKEQYVNKNETNWTTNYHRKKMLRFLMDEGYTIFYTNFNQEHMGNDETVERIHNLYEYVIRTEIINEKIHVIAEGTGAIIALDMLANKQNRLRSIVYINPVFSLEWLTDLVKDQPFLYKRIITDMAEAYRIHEEQCEEIIKTKGTNIDHKQIPFVILHILEHGIRDTKWVQLYKTYFKNMKDHIYVLLPEQRLRTVHYVKDLLKKAEQVL